MRDQRLANRQARKARVARGLVVSRRPRLTVFRSAKHIYAQIVDPENGRTLAGVSTRTPTVRGGVSSTGGVDAAKAVGTAIAARARSQGIEQVVFNRNGFLYHGRVKALAEAAREAGLEF
ncbi:MAG: 50S ribosomal protein L18 [Myxococcota bacterium]